MAKSKYELSNNDKKILDVLIENARQSLIDISEKTGLSRQTVQKTINKLEKESVIWGYKTVVNFKSTGKKIFIILLKTSAKLSKDRLQEIFPITSKEMQKNVGISLIHTGLTHGDFDWFLIFAADDIVLANKIMRRWESQYSDIITDIKIVEELLPIRLCGALNPNYKEGIDEVL